MVCGRSVFWFKGFIDGAVFLSAEGVRVARQLAAGVRIAEDAGRGCLRLRFFQKLYRDGRPRFQVGGRGRCFARNNWGGGDASREPKVAKH